MNKKAQLGGLTIVLIIFIFLIGFGVLNVIKPEVSTARGADGFNCINASAITDGTKLTCLAVDITIPLIVWGLISLFAGIKVGRFVTLKR